MLERKLLSVAHVEGMSMRKEKGSFGKFGLVFFFFNPVYRQRFNKFIPCSLSNYNYIYTIQL